MYCTYIIYILKKNINRGNTKVLLHLKINNFLVKIKNFYIFKLMNYIVFINSNLIMFKFN